MRSMKCLAFALLASAALSGDPAFAKVCQIGLRDHDANGRILSVHSPWHD